MGVSSRLLRGGGVRSSSHPATDMLVTRHVATWSTCQSSTRMSPAPATSAALTLRAPLEPFVTRKT